MTFKKEELPLSMGQKVTLKVRNEVFNVWSEDGIKVNI